MFRTVQTTFWTDPKNMEEMTPEDRYFYLYILTNPNSTQSGIYVLTKKQMAFEMGYSPESVDSLITRFQDHHKLIKYNPETREIAIKNWGKYNLNRGGKPMEDCITKELSEVKDKSLLSYVVENIENESIKKLYYNFIESDIDTSTLRQRIDIRQDTNIEEERINNITTTATSENSQDEHVNFVDNVDNCDYIKLFNENLHFMTPMELQIFQSFISDGIEPAVLKFAIQEAIISDAKTMKYIKAILERWLAHGLKTLEAVIADKKSWENRKKGKDKYPPKEKTFSNYDQRPDAVESYKKIQEINRNELDSVEINEAALAGIGKGLKGGG